MKNKETLSDRIKLVLFEEGLSQAEGARKCDISQQTLNYIIKNKLDRTKLANQIALGLGVRSEWLISGRGEKRAKKQTTVYVIKDLDMLKVLMMNRGDVRIETETFKIDGFDYIKKMFAIRYENKVVIFSNEIEDFNSMNKIEYIKINENGFEISDNKISEFLVIEKRISNVK